MSSHSIADKHKIWSISHHKSQTITFSYCFYWLDSSENLNCFLASHFHSVSSLLEEYSWGDSCSRCYCWLSLLAEASDSSYWEDCLPCWLGSYRICDRCTPLHCTGCNRQYTHTFSWCTIFPSHPWRRNPRKYFFSTSFLRRFQAFFWWCCLQQYRSLYSWQLLIPLRCRGCENVCYWRLWCRSIRFGNTLWIWGYDFPTRRERFLRDSLT